MLEKDCAQEIHLSSFASFDTLAKRDTEYEGSVFVSGHTLSVRPIYIEDTRCISAMNLRCISEAIFKESCPGREAHHIIETIRMIRCFPRPGHDRQRDMIASRT